MVVRGVAPRVLLGGLVANAFELAAAVDDVPKTTTPPPPPTTSSDPAPYPTFLIIMVVVILCVFACAGAWCFCRASASWIARCNDYFNGGHA